MKIPNYISQKLSERIENASLRTLKTNDNLIDFSSNDYLGLASSKNLFEAIKFSIQSNVDLLRLNGSTGSRLLRGNSTHYEQLEQKIALFHDAESALLFNSGYDANLGLISSIGSRNDILLYDKLIHASMHDGMKMSKAESIAFPHNDVVWLNKIEQEKEIKGNVFVLTEAVFSMDGDEANLEELVQLCEEKSWYLIVDEAHAIGIKGEKGEGLTQSFALHKKTFSRIITYGKAPGVHGAAVLGNQALKDFLVNFARPLIYSTAMPYHQLKAIETSYEFFTAMKSERNKLNEMIEDFNHFASINFKSAYLSSHSPIQSVIIGGNEKTKDFANYIIGKGLDVRPILSPTVPRNSERIRICLHVFNSKAELSLLKNTLLEAKKIFFK